MPQLGEAVTEATVTKWLKSVGDSVAEYDALLEVNTDKVDSEIPSPVTGVLLAALAQPNEVVKVGALLGWVGQPGDAVPGLAPPLPAGEGQGKGISPPPAPVGEGRAAEVSPPPAPVGEGQPRESIPGPASPLPVGEGQGEGISAPSAPLDDSSPRDLGFLSPVVKRIAAEQNVDLRQVRGTGLGGRITKQDILAHLETRKTAPAERPAPSLPLSPDALRPPSPSFPLSSSSTLLPMTPVRRAIAEHMVMSKHTSPHVTTIMEVDMSRVVAHRSANKAAFARDGVNLTYTAYFIAAIVAALKAYPVVNSSWSEAGILLHSQINIGMATSLGEEGLIVPVIKHADSLSLLGLARTINDLANRARAKKLLPDEVKGGTFTITNHGISGSLFATPVINQPQCGILGVGALQKRPVVISDPALGDVIAIRPMLYISLTFDHRILDGASADWFLAKVVESLQNYSP